MSPSPNTICGSVRGSTGRGYAATHPGVRFFDPQEVLCGPQACDIVQNGKALYFDDTHLNPLGADRVIVRMLERIGPI